VISISHCERTLRFAAVILALGAYAHHADAQRRGGRAARVLLLYQQQAETRPMMEFTEPLRATLQAEMRSPVEFYQEALDLDRFADREHSLRLVQYFEDKYHGFGIDVVVPVGGRALTFAIEQLSSVLPDAPIVFALCAAPQTDPSGLPGDVTGRLATASRFAPTVMMARRLQPDAERVVVVGGAGPSDSVAARAAASAVHSLGDPLPVAIIQGLSFDAMLPKLRQLPRRSIVIFSNYRQDGLGHAYEPLDIVGSIARASAAPMYTQLRSYVGEGVVGGSVTRFDDEGVRTARLVARVLRRQRGEPMPPVQVIENSFVADSRQLRRWGMSEARLPDGTDVLFREATPWQRYRSVVVFAIVIVGLESLLITSLLVERRKRKRAQVVLDEQQRRVDDARRQMAHMGRVALVGELAATISHEIRQPLTAIRTSAETGAKLLKRHAEEFVPAHREIGEELFHDILAANERAAEIITRVRALLRGEESPQRPFDLNEVCRSAMRLLEAEAITRHARLSLALCTRPAVVVGDAIQFQQVVLNLALNALDASTSSADPLVLISTDARDDVVELAVHDNGTGLAADVQQHLFQSFFTTKATGLGLGLVIVQSIVERHNGRVYAENDKRGGATFHVVMPSAASASTVSPVTMRPPLAAQPSIGD
jgi:signal transduction histidine kinase